MFKRIVAGTVTILFTLGLTACAPTTPTAPLEIRSGVIQQISATQIANSHETGVGAVIGALGGLGVGALIGSGTGKAVAMVLGAVGGAVGGHVQACALIASLPNAGRAGHAVHRPSN